MPGTPDDDPDAGAPWASQPEWAVAAFEALGAAEKDCQARLDALEGDPANGASAARAELLAKVARFVACRQRIARTAGDWIRVPVPACDIAQWRLAEARRHAPIPSEGPRLPAEPAHPHVATRLLWWRRVRHNRPLPRPSELWEARPPGRVWRWTLGTLLALVAAVGAAVTVLRFAASRR